MAADCSLSNRTSTEQALITNLSRRSCNHASSTLLARGRVPFRRSSSEPVLRPKTESSPGNVPAGGRPPKKNGSRILFLRRESTLWKSIPGCEIVQNKPESGTYQRPGRFLHHFPSVRPAISCDARPDSSIL